MTEEKAPVIVALDRLENAIRALAKTYKAEKQANAEIMPRIEAMIQGIIEIVPVAEATPPQAEEITLTETTEESNGSDLGEWSPQ